MAYHSQVPLYACSVGMTLSEFLSRSSQLASQHYWPVQVVSYDDSAGSRYAAIWIQNLRSALATIQTGLSSSAYQQKFDDLNQQGYKLLCVSGVSAGGSEYSGLWQDGGWKGFTARHGLSANDYQSEFDKLSADGYQLIWVNGHSNGITSSYSGIWSKFASGARHAHHNLPISEYQGVYDAYKADGYGIAQFSAHRVKSTTYVAAIWIKQDGYNPAARHSMTECQLQNELERQAFNDYRPICITGYLDSGGTKYAGIWVKNSRSFLKQGRMGSGLDSFDTGVKDQMLAGGITAASLAVSYQGRLVMARGYGNLTAEEEPVSPTSIFRVASVSKAITGTAIVKLIEQGKLDYNDKLVDLLGWQDAVKDNRLKSVTVDQLLHHVSGWDPSVDPMFNDQTIASDLKIPLPITQESIFRWFATTQMLDHAPGTFYSYSNYGFMLLGMIIERVAGQEYEDFVSENLLLPLDIRRMRLARTEFAGRWPGEVTYHHPRTVLFRNVMEKDSPADAMEMHGRYNFVNMAAHGSWVASAVDLVKFASAFDNAATCPILNASSVNSLLGRTLPPAAANDTCGWSYKAGSPSENYKTGNFHGTGAIMYHRSDGINVGLIFNRTTAEPLSLPCGEDPPTTADSKTPLAWNTFTLVRSWIAGVKTWPSLDMWSEFF